MSLRAVLIAAALLAPPGSATDVRGVVVERVAPASVAEKAGLRPGDRLLRWDQQGTSGGELGTPFDLLDAELERGPRGAVRLSGRRAGVELEVELFPDEWGLQVQPADGQQSSPELEAWRRLKVALGHADDTALDGALLAYEDALAAARAVRPSVEAHVQAALARWLGDRGQPERALTAASAALELRRGFAPDSLAVAQSLDQEAVLRTSTSSDFQPSLRALEQAREILQRHAPRSLAAAALLEHLGRVTTVSGDVATGIALQQQSLARREQLWPDGLAVASGLCYLGYDLTVRGDFDAGGRMMRRAEQIQERLAPDSLEHAATLHLLGRTERYAGDAAAASEHLRRALTIRERRAPDSPELAESLRALGVVAQESGDLAAADSLYGRALALLERQAPGSVDVAKTLNNLGVTATDRLDLDAAEGYFQRALEIHRRGSPGGTDAAVALGNLADVARARGDLAQTERHLREASALIEKIAPQGLAMSLLLARLGEVLEARGRLDEARASYQRARELRETLAPRTRGLGRILDGLGRLAFARGDLEEAESLHRAALAVHEQVAPGSVWEAESCQGAARSARKRGRHDEALALLRRAVEALEVQSRRLGGSPETRARFRAHYRAVYRDLEELLLERGQQQEAFEVVERSRARVLLAQLAARDVRFDRDVPAELESERRQADADYDRVLRRLGSDQSLDDLRRAQLGGELQAARRRQDEARERIRVAAPRLASLRDPQPLDLAGVRSVLDGGTLALVYSLGEAESRVYALGPSPGEFAVFEVAAGEAAVREGVRRLREAIEARRGRLQAPVVAQAARLSRLLLAPAAAPLARAERLLVVPDGALHLLPFAVLQDPGSAARRRFLIEARPLHVVSSITLLAELRRSAAQPSQEVVAFADPVYPRLSTQGSSAALSGALRAALRLVPLPGTRREVEGLRELSREKARLFFGKDATEERAKSLSGAARVVHFASHGFVDEAFPLESGLALSIPEHWQAGQQNGLLQAWEVFEQVRLDADLVTLSACETAVGPEVAGEGLLSLTRAFQYAGARSVLASLWRVDDASTSALMRSLYRHIGSGVPKAEALRRAQRELLAQPATSGPYFWSAFQLTGDWR